MWTSLLPFPAQVPHLHDEPKWTRLLPLHDSKRAWPAVHCPEWLEETSVGCDERWEDIVSWVICIRVPHKGIWGKCRVG